MASAGNSTASRRSSSGQQEEAQTMDGEQASLAIILFAFLLSTNVTPGATLYVDASASEPGDGSS